MWTTRTPLRIQQKPELSIVKYQHPKPFTAFSCKILQSTNPYQTYLWHLRRLFLPMDQRYASRLYVWIYGLSVVMEGLDAVLSYWCERDCLRLNYFRHLDVLSENKFSYVLIAMDMFILTRMKSNHVPFEESSKIFRICDISLPIPVEKASLITLFSGGKSPVPVVMILV